MLVLLVIFIITAPLLTRAVKLDLRARRPPPRRIPRRPSSCRSTRKGSCSGRARPLSEAQLISRFTAAGKQPSPPEIHLRADRATRYETIAHVMADAQRRGTVAHRLRDVARHGLQVAARGWPRRRIPNESIPARPLKSVNEPVKAREVASSASRQSPVASRQPGCRGVWRGAVRPRNAATSASRNRTWPPTGLPPRPIRRIRAPCLTV